MGIATRSVHPLEHCRGRPSPRCPGDEREGRSGRGLVRCRRGVGGGADQLRLAAASAPSAPSGATTSGTREHGPRRTSARPLGPKRSALVPATTRPHTGAGGPGRAHEGAHVAGAAHVVQHQDRTGTGHWRRRPLREGHVAPPGHYDDGSGRHRAVTRGEGARFELGGGTWRPGRATRPSSPGRRHHRPGDEGSSRMALASRAAATARRPSRWKARSPARSSLAAAGQSPHLLDAGATAGQG